MAYDEGLAERLREQFSEWTAVEEKKMFGGLCFMLGQHMCCGIVKEDLMARVGPDEYQRCLSLPHVRKMDFTGREMKGYVYVAPPGFESDAQLAEWVGLCADFVITLPPKKTKKV